MAVKIRFRMSWRHFRRGYTCEMADGMANVLLSRGIVEVVEPQTVVVTQAPAAGTATLVPPAAVAVQPGRGKRRA